MIKWKEYKQLTPTQRVEWRFKYRRDIPKFGFVNSAVMLFLINVVYMALCLVSYVHPDVSFFTPFSMWRLAVATTGVFIAITLMSVFVEITIFFYNLYKEHKWLKRVGVR